MKKLMFKERRKGNETIERKKREREKRRSTRTSKQRTKGEKREESGGWGGGGRVSTHFSILSMKGMCISVYISQGWGWG